MKTPGKCRGGHALHGQLRAVATLLLLGLAACGRADRAQPASAGLGDSVPTSQAWSLKEIATIRSGDDDPFMNLRSLALDGDGNVYVLDLGARKIRVFDSTGVPLRTIGREGRGPAEFLSPYSLAWTGDTLVVFDPGNGRLELVTRDGQHAATWPGSRITGGPQVRLWQAGPSRFFQNGFRGGADGALQMLYVTGGPDGGSDTLIIPPATDAGKDALLQCDGENGSIYFFDVPHASHRLNAVSPDGRVVAAHTGEYRFTWFAPDGTPQNIMAYGATPIPISEAAWDSARAEYAAWRNGLPPAECDHTGLPRPPAEPAFRSVEFDDQGRMWVEATKETGHRFDVWEPMTGKRFASFPAPVRDEGVPFVVRGERVVVVRNENDGQVVALYRLSEDPGN